MPSPASLDLIKRLIAFDTTSAKSNLALIDFVRGYLDRHGVASELVFDADGGKANLYATIGPADRPTRRLTPENTWYDVEGGKSLARRRVWLDPGEK